LVEIDGTMLDGCPGRIRGEIVAAFSVGPGPDGPGTKAAAAIGADVVQDLFDTGLQKVHSNEQIIASVEFGGSAVLQFSQAGLSSSMGVP